MGQKVNPHGLRVGVIKDWDSKWYADAEFSDYLVEDYNIRKYLKKKLFAAGVSKIEIERTSDRVKVIIYTAKPGVVIGKGGAEIEVTKNELSKLTGKVRRFEFIFCVIELVIVREWDLRAFVAYVVDSCLGTGRPGRLRNDRCIGMARIKDERDPLFPDDTEHVFFPEAPYFDVEPFMCGEHFTVLADNGHKDLTALPFRLGLFSVCECSADFSAVLCSGNDPDHALYPLGVIIFPSATKVVLLPMMTVDCMSTCSSGSFSSVEIVQFMPGRPAFLTMPTGVSGFLY